MPTIRKVNGRTLTLDPINTALEQVREALQAGRTAVVVLEPGDASRYMLILGSVDEYLLVVRVSGGWALADCDGAVTIEDPATTPVEPWQVEALSNGNAHTALVLCGFLNVLLGHDEAVR